MVFQAHEGALIERFSSVSAAGASDLDLDAVGAVSEHLQSLAEEGLKRGIQVLMDMGDAADLGGGLRGLNGVTAARQHLDQQQEKEEKQRAEDQIFLSLLQGRINALDREIDRTNEQIKALEAKIDILENTIEGLRNGTVDVDDLLEKPEVADAIKVWEAKTGLKFDPDDDDAEEILIAIMEERVDQFGKDIAVQKQRVGELEDQKERLVEQANTARAEYAETGTISAATREAVNASAEGAITLMKEARDTAAVFQIGSEDCTSHRDGAFADASDFSENDDAFGGLLGEMQGEAVDQFQAAAAPPSEQPTPQPEQSPAINPEMAG